MNLICLLIMAMIVVLSPSLAQSPSPAVYSIDAGQSRIELTVFRGGLLKVIGHDHRIAARSFSGEVRVSSGTMENSSVALNIESASLVVLDDPKLSEKDRKEVQANMEGAEVLNIKEFPNIMFRSTKLSKSPKDSEEFTLTGRLNLHGVEKEITIPVHIHFGNNLLRTTGTVTIAQTEFGITPLKGAAGTLRLKDQIRIVFDVAAKRTAP